MKLGIIGLPNSGKTTLFNALTGLQAETAPYPNPIATEPHVGVIKVPDRRIDRLSTIFQPRKKVYADVICLDITGFARGISTSRQKSGLFNQLWGADAILHVVRAFEDEKVSHPGEGIDPGRDAAALELELIFHDLELVETRLERIATAIKKGIGKEFMAERAVLEKCRSQLEQEKPLRNLDINEAERAAVGSLMFASLKPELVLLNVGEEEIAGARTAARMDALRAYYAGRDALVFALSAKIEMEISRLPAHEAGAFLEDLGITEPAMNRVIREVYELLGLISFFTVGEDEVRAWTIRNGTRAVRAAGKVHSDIERGFIKAEVIGYDDFVAAGTMARAKEKALLRLEGKDYTVQDGDIINFRFNV
ncbi:MAG: redox-regulated ATPase YchF [Thermoleophilia bacterium]|nr:redox-regulated ATPase YchF [Thermoleophilia bacterium]